LHWQLGVVRSFWFSGHYFWPSPNYETTTQKGQCSTSASGALGEITVDSEGNHKEFIDPQEIKDGAASLVGAIFTIVGTVVWGFGDLV